MPSRAAGKRGVKHGSGRRGKRGLAAADQGGGQLRCWDDKAPPRPLDPRPPPPKDAPLLPRLAVLLLLLPLLACTERYSPDTYATRAVQQANRVEQGVVIGVRKVQISAEGSTGAAAGAAAGGVLGAQTPGGGVGQGRGGGG